MNGSSKKHKKYMHRAILAFSNNNHFKININVPPGLYNIDYHTSYSKPAQVQLMKA